MPSLPCLSFFPIGDVKVSANGSKLNLATLASSVEGLKGTNNKSTFYKDFAKGLVIGSGNLVNSRKHSI